MIRHFHFDYPTCVQRNDGLGVPKEAAEGEEGSDWETASDVSDSEMEKDPKDWEKWDLRRR